MQIHRFLLPAVLLLLAGCGGPTPTAVPSVAAENTAVPASPASPAAPQPTAVLPSAAAPLPIETAGALALQVFSPQDEAVVNTAEVQVTGVTSPGAVLSINDVILIAGADGSFTAAVPLEEGPNLIEIVASDAAGDETSLLLSVTYEP